MDKKLWKCIRSDMRSDYGNHTWELKKWYKISGAPIICENGFHASKYIPQVFSWVRPGLLCQVEVNGESVIEKEKECWSEMRIIKVYKWTKEMSVKLAIYAAKLALPIWEEKYPKDNRPRKAIEASEKWLKKEIATAAVYPAAVVRATDAPTYAAAAARAATYAADADDAAHAAAYAAEAVDDADVAYTIAMGFPNYTTHNDIIKKCHKYAIGLLLQNK